MPPRTRAYGFQEQADGRVTRSSHRGHTVTVMRTPIRSRVTASVVLTVYLLAGAVVVFWPTTVGESTAASLAVWLHRDPQVTLTTVEWLANVALFVPIGICLRLIVGRWWLASAVALAFSTAIELIQWIALPGRVASISDILANTAGAVLGSVFAAAAVWTVRAHARRPAPQPHVEPGYDTSGPTRDNGLEPAAIGVSHRSIPHPGGVNVSDPIRVLMMTAKVIAPGGGPPGYTFNLRDALSEAGLIDESVSIRFWGADRDERYQAAPNSDTAGRSGTVVSAVKDRTRRAVVQSSLGARFWEGLQRWRSGELREERAALDAIRGCDVLVLQGYQSVERARAASRQGTTIVYMPHSPSIRADEERMVAARTSSPLTVAQHRILLKREAELIRRAEVVVFPAEAAADAYWAAFEHELHATEIRYVRSSVPSPVPRSVRQPSTNPVVLFVGRYVEHKGYDLFVRAAEALAAKLPRVRFVTLGSGPDRMNSDAVTDLGWSDDPHSMIATADVVVVPNRVAYYDLLPLEVAALGRGMVMTKVGGNNDQLSLLPDSVAVTIDGVVEGIEEAVMLAEKNPTWGLKNVGAFEEHFRGDRFAKEWHALLCDVGERGHNR